MIPVLALVQEGQITETVTHQLKTGLSEIALSEFDQVAEIRWLEVKPGNGFSDAVSSRASIVSLQANQPLPQDRRIAVMHRLCDLWRDKTGCSINEIVASVSDPVTTSVHS